MYKEILKIRTFYIKISSLYLVFGCLRNIYMIHEKSLFFISHFNIIYLRRTIRFFEKRNGDFSDESSWKT